MKTLRLPYTPLPLNARGVGISSWSRQSGAAQWKWKKIRIEAVRRHGPRCYYCGASPSVQAHDCHEIFEVRSRARIVRLIDIVPACHLCHEWADGKVFLQESYFRTERQLKRFMRNWLGDNYESDPDLHLFADYFAFRAINHFRRVNRMSIAKAKSVFRATMRRLARQNRIPNWHVDYGEWHETLGFLSGKPVKARGWKKTG